MTADLLVVGAGPKGVAVAAKAAAMSRLGLPAPSVVLDATHQRTLDIVPMALLRAHAIKE